MSQISFADAGELSGSGDWKPVLLRILAVVFTFMLVAEVAFYLVIVPSTSRSRLTISGARTVGYDELCSLAGLDGSDKWIRIDSAAVASRLAANPLFESVSVQKIFPDRVSIAVTERVPVAVSFGTVNGRTVPLEIDASGVVFRIGGLDTGCSLPLLTGLTFENPVAGMRLDERLRPLLGQLSDIGAKNPMLLSSVSEIKIEQKTYGGYDLVVYPVHTQVRVRTDRTLNEDSLQYMMLLLDVVRDLALDIDEIDIRAGTVAYRVRGEHQ